MAMNRLYQTFVQIVESETIVRAATALHLTQPTVSRQLQQLEAELGQPLFERMAGRLVLTRAGEIVYRTATRLLTSEDKMREELSSLANPEVGVVYIGSGVTPAIYLLPSFLAGYRRVHPGVRLHLQTGSSRSVLGALEQREIDAGFVTTVPDNHDNLAVRSLYQDDLLLVAAPDHPLALKPATTVADLAHHPFIVMPANSGLRRLTEDLMGRPGLEWTIAMEVDSLESISRLIQVGVGISLVPRSCVQDDLVAGRLHVVHLMDVPPQWRTVSLVTRTEGTLTAAAQRFVDEVPPWFAHQLRALRSSRYLHQG